VNHRDQLARFEKQQPSALCDSECEGRCKVCPADWASELLAAYREAVVELEKVRGELLVSGLGCVQDATRWRLFRARCGMVGFDANSFCHMTDTQIDASHGCADGRDSVTMENEAGLAVLNQSR
jgi:hypothetical protein